MNGPHRGARTLGLTLVSVLLSTPACITSAPTPQDHYYRLPERVPPKTEASAHDRALRRLAVARPQADGLLTERSIVYVLSEHPLEVRQYRYHHWSQPPADLIQERLLDLLRSRGIAEVVSRPVPGEPADLTVSSRINRFERNVSEAQVSVTVVLELGLRSGQRTTPEWSDRYAATAVANNTSLHATVEAFDRALGQVLDRFVQDLRARTGLKGQANSVD